MLRKDKYNTTQLHPHMYMCKQFMVGIGGRGYREEEFMDMNIYTWKKGVSGSRAEPTKQTVDSFFRLVGPHQCHVCMAALHVHVLVHVGYSVLSISVSSLKDIV